MAAMDGFRSKQFYINFCTIFFSSSAEMSVDARFAETRRRNYGRIPAIIYKATTMR